MLTPHVDAAFQTSLLAHLPEVRSLNEQLATAPLASAMDITELRRTMAEGGGVFPAPVRLDHAVERQIPGPPGAGPVTIRVLVPERVDGAYLYIHGGGWFIGGRDQSDVTLWALARHANVAVVSVGYRLVPEHPYPAGPDDCEAAALWFVEHAAEEFGTDRLTIGGASAGGHLAAATLLRLRDRHGLADRFCGADLLFGVFDLSRSPSQRNMGQVPIMGSAAMEPMYKRFLPGKTVEDRRSPEISPLFADLGGMPPALFSIGTLDPLLDDSLFMAARWAVAANHAELAVYPECPHGFTLLPTAMARACVQRQQSFVRDAVAGTLPTP